MSVFKDCGDRSQRRDLKCMVSGESAGAVCLLFSKGELPLTSQDTAMTTMSQRWRSLGSPPASAAARWVPGCSASQSPTPRPRRRAWPPGTAATPTGPPGAPGLPGACNRDSEPARLPGASTPHRTSSSNNDLQLRRHDADSEASPPLGAALRRPGGAHHYPSQDPGDEAEEGRGEDFDPDHASSGRAPTTAAAQDRSALERRQTKLSRAVRSKHQLAKLRVVANLIRGGAPERSCPRGGGGMPGPPAESSISDGRGPPWAGRVTHRRAETDALFQRVLPPTTPVRTSQDFARQEATAPPASTCRKHGRRHKPVERPRRAPLTVHHSRPYPSGSARSSRGGDSVSLPVGTPATRLRTLPRSVSAPTTRPRRQRQRPRDPKAVQARRRGGREDPGGGGALGKGGGDGARRHPAPPPHPTSSRLLCFGPARSSETRGGRRRRHPAAFRGPGPLDLPPVAAGPPPRAKRPRNLHGRADGQTGGRPDERLYAASGSRLRRRRRRLGSGNGGIVAHASRTTAQCSKRPLGAPLLPQTPTLRTWLRSSPLIASCVRATRTSTVGLLTVLDEVRLG
ncbi:unnamed protein product [Gadus morhua 'NCC']